jgi:RNA polymerase sigma factor (sigma-70 family)
MPIREGEKFKECFLADTQEEAEKLLKEFETDITMLSYKFASIARSIDHEDLKQEGIIGLARASRDFEKDRSESFRIFAIYKIKDAMREFVSTQGSNIKFPQYVKEAIRLILELRKTMEKGGSVGHVSFVDIWEISKTMKVEKPIREEIDKVRATLKNLCERSHTSVIQMLERAELMPTTTSVALESYDHERLPSDDNFQVEDNMISYLSTRQSVERLKEFLSQDELDLLYARFVEGKTVRELEPEMGITAESIVVRTNNILNKLKRNEKRILYYESDSDIKEIESGYSGRGLL